MARTNNDNENDYTLGGRFFKSGLPDSNEADETPLAQLDYQAPSVVAVMDKYQHYLKRKSDMAKLILNENNIPFAAGMESYEIKQTGLTNVLNDRMVSVLFHSNNPVVNVESGNDENDNINK